MGKKDKENKFSVFEVTPKLIVRTIFYLLVSPLVYRETGIWTTILLGLVYLEIAVKTDWMQALHELQMTMGDMLKGVVEFQYEFVATRIKGKKNEPGNT